MTLEDIGVLADLKEVPCKSQGRACPVRVTGHESMHGKNLCKICVCFLGLSDVVPTCDSGVQSRLVVG